MVTAAELADRLLQEKESFDRRIASNPNLSQVQRLRLWEDFLDCVRPLAVLLAEAEQTEAYRRNYPLVEVYPN